MVISKSWTYVFFLIIFSLISLVNHYNFKTANLDLGAYTNALYDYSHLQFNYSESFKLQKENLLASHFDLYLPIFSLFSYFFKSYTLLIIQLFFIMLGAKGVSKVITLVTNNESLGFWSSIHFLSFFGIYTALSFDYHSNVIATMLLPWLFYYLYQKKYKLFYLVWFGMLIGQENISLWLFFIGIGFSFYFRKEKQMVVRILVLSLISVIYFYIVTQNIMPALRNDGGVGYRFEYAVLGDNIGSAVSNLFIHPLDSLKYLIYKNDLSAISWFKVEMILSVLFSGGLLLFKKPQFLIILIPIFLQKLFHNNPNIWGCGFHYSIEFSVVVSIGAFIVIGNIKSEKWRKLLVAFTIISSLIVTVRLMDNPICYINKGNIRFYQKEHYVRNYDLSLFKKDLSLIPNNAKLSTQSSIIPNFSYRDKVYLFPNVKDADYIVYSKYEDAFPLEHAQLKEELKTYKESSNWNIVIEKDYCLILKKKNE